MKKKKVLILASVFLNLVLGGYGILASYSNRANSEDFQRADNQRLEDVKLLAGLLKGRITKQEAQSYISRQYKAEDYFDKPAENGIGINGLFLKFNQQSRLEEVEAYTLQGP